MDVEYDVASNGTGGYYIAKTLFDPVNGEIHSAITGNDVSINPISSFYIKDTATATVGHDYIQPKIVIVIKGGFTGAGMPSGFNLQTTVSQRRLDI
jgi:hypothetical protein